MQVTASRSSVDGDEVMVTLRMADGTVATIAYLVGGDPGHRKSGSRSSEAAPPEQSTTSSGATISVNGRRKKSGGFLTRQDKGHFAEVKAFADSIARGSGSPVTFASAVNSTQATFAILSSLEAGTTVDVDSRNG